MENKIFEVGTEINVEALISRLRQSADQRGMTVGKTRPQMNLGPGILKPLQPQLIAGEMQGAGVSAEQINQIPVKARGTKGRIELRVKRFIKWFVHWNTKGQVDFNHIVIRSFGLLVQELQTTNANFARLESLVRDLADRSGKLERTLGEVQAEIRRHTQSTTVDASREVERKSLLLLTEQLNDLSARLDDVNRRQDATADLVASEQQRVGQMVGEAAQNLQAHLGVAGANLQEEIKKDLQQVLEETRRNTDALAAQSSELSDKVDHKIDELTIRTLRLERTAHSDSLEAEAAQVTKRDYVSTTSPEARTHEGNRKQTLPRQAAEGAPFGQAFDYFLFEHQHRGPVSEIKRRQSIYLDLFRDKKDAVDLGCGRGEFVELLSENGINVTGVDSNPDMVDFCQNRGLQVVQADIFEYLASAPDKKFDGMFIAQVVEHMPPERILDLLSLCGQKLKPGGVIVAETVNTNCLLALSNFYLDPTHVRPVPPEMLKFMFEQESFEFRTFKFSSPIPGSDGPEVLDLASGYDQEGNAYQDYAVVAFKLDTDLLEPTAAVDEAN